MSMTDHATKDRPPVDPAATQPCHGFSLAHRHDHRGWVLEVGGEVDLAAARPLADALAGLGGYVKVDCSTLTSIDSAGLHVLTEAHFRLLRSGGRLDVCGLARAPFRTFERARLDEVLNIESTDADGTPAHGGRRRHPAGT
jgi:anti-anti-sigma factor